MAWTNEILQLRGLVDDTTTSNQARHETPTNKRDSSNKIFQLEKYPIVNSSVYLTLNTTIRTQAGFTIDNVNGLMTFVTAPVGTENPFYVDYYWNWFVDNDYSNFLDIASYDLGFGPTLTIPSGLINALLHYGKHHFFKRMASRYAYRFASSGGGQGQSIDVVTKQYKQLADEAWQEAETMKLAYYERHGQRNQPATSVKSSKIDPWTPMR
jgi:hypothetical protein